MNNILKSAIGAVSLSTAVNMTPMMTSEEREFYKRKIKDKVRKAKRRFR